MIVWPNIIAVNFFKITSCGCNQLAEAFSKRKIQPFGPCTWHHPSAQCQDTLCLDHVSKLPVKTASGLCASIKGAKQVAKQALKTENVLWTIKANDPIWFKSGFVDVIAYYRTSCSVPMIFCGWPVCVRLLLVALNERFRLWPLVSNPLHLQELGQRESFCRKLIHANEPWYHIYIYYIHIYI